MEAACSQQGEGKLLTVSWIPQSILLLQVPDHGATVKVDISDMMTRGKADRCNHRALISFPVESNR
jgi:hypothetical protein